MQAPPLPSKTTRKHMCLPSTALVLDHAGPTTNLRKDFEDEVLIGCFDNSANGKRNAQEREDDRAVQR
jgi:hypothetical protein